MPKKSASELTTISNSLSVTENSGLTSIGILAPVDSIYPSSSLTITVTRLPNNGTVYLSDGVTAVFMGETLTVSQLTGLKFRPGTAAFGKGSTFTYNVTDPSGVTVRGIESFSISAAPAAPVTTPISLIVAENSGPTTIGIVAPADPNYSASQLRIQVTGLPTSGTLLLSDGVTTVTNSQILTVAQLTGLKFRPATGLFGATSMLTYNVTDPSGLTATGNASLSIAPDSLPPIATPISVSVAENSGAAAIGIPTPSDPNYSASQLTVQVTALPTDGAVLLSDGITPVLNGELLTIAQLTALEFKPLTNTFGTSSTFCYNVSDPSGLNATGTAILAIEADSLLPSTTPTSLTVAGNSGPTPIQIAEPTDPNYSASQLTITIMALPSYGTVTLADGVTRVSPGESLTSSQLTGLAFQPDAGSFGKTSTLTYTVTDPSGLHTNGTVGFAIGADTQPPVTADPTLTVLGNSGATPIGIPTPTDPSYSAPQLTVTVTGLPSDGAILLSDGVTPVTAGEALTVAQLTGLKFRPTIGVTGQSSNFTYTVTNPAGLTATGIETLAIYSANIPSTSVPPISGTPPISTPTSVTNPVSTTSPSSITTPTSSTSTLWQDPGSGSTSAPGIYNDPTVAQPSQTGDIVGVRLQNTATTIENGGYVTFGELFRDGAVQPGDGLLARIGGINYAVQMDVESTNADGSVRQAVLTIQVPSIAAGGTLDLMLAHGTPTPPSAAAPSALALLGSGYDITANFTFHNPDGTTTTDSASAAAALRQGLSAGSIRTWLSGPGVNEFDVVTTVDGGKLKVEFDIRAYANGTTTTDVIFDNSWMFAPGRTDLNYDVSINQAGQQVYSATGVQQYLYSLWDHQVASAGTISPNVQYDVPYLIATGAVPAYDTSIGVDSAAIQYNYGGVNTPGGPPPMSTGNVTTFMSATGGRQDIGPQPNWTAQWLLSQDAAAHTVMMADAAASGSIPWHFTDETTGKSINAQTYPNFWQSNISQSEPARYLQPANGWPQYSVTGSPTADGDPWLPDAAHLPDLNYLPFLTTGSSYQLRLLQAEANFAITAVQGSQTALDSYNTVLLGFPASFSNENRASNGNQTRAVAWELRTVAEAAYLTPDSDPLRAYFINQLDMGMNGLVREYITDNVNGAYGQLNGFIEGTSGPGNGTGGLMVAPWQEDFVVTSLAEIAGMNIPQASADAVQMMQFMNNFVSGLFTNGPNGYNPLDGTAEWIYINGSNGTGAPFTTWSQLYSANLQTNGPDGYNGVYANPTRLINWPTVGLGGYGPVAMAALADEITYTQSPQAIQAYGFVVSQVANAFALAGQDEAATFQASPEFSIMPRLPDGVWLPNSQTQIDTSGASTVTLTARGGDSLLAIVGNGTATLNGGSGTTDLMYGGTGSTTLNPGPGNDYLFGAYNATGTTTFNDNTGNNWMHGGGGPNTYVFVENGSGHDRIDNFNLATDRLQVRANINGNGVASSSQLIAGATVSDGNTVFHLGANNDITLLGISEPSTLISSIFVS